MTPEDKFDTFLLSLAIGCVMFGCLYLFAWVVSQ